MRNKTFYPELIVKFINEPAIENEILLDNNQKAVLKFEVGSGVNIEEYFKKLSDIKTNDNIINRKLKEIKKDKTIKKEIRQAIYKERPDLKGIDPDEDEELYEEFLEQIDKKLHEKAKELAKNESRIKKGSIVKLAGITEINNDKIEIKSKSINTDSKGNPTLSGMYMFAVISRKLPVVIKQNKHKKPLILLHPLVNKEQLDVYIRNQLKTIEATTKEKIKLRNKEYKLNNVPKPYITLNKNFDFPDTIKTAVEIINTKIEEIEKKDISSFLKQIKNNEDITHKYQKYLIALKYLFEFIVNNFDNGILKYINIYLPLGLNENDYKEMLNVVLKGNKSGKEGRLGIIDSLLNTTFVKYKEHKIRIEEIISNKYWELYENNKLKFNSTYTVEINTNVGFFPQNINTKNAVLSSDNYTEIIEEVYKFLKSLKK